MRIAFVHPSSPGAEGTGATHTATLLVRALADRGHDVTVLCRRSPAGGDDPGGTVEVRDLGLSGPPYHTATQLNRALRDRLRNGGFDGFDAVHSYLPSSIPAMGLVGRETAARTVVTLNAYGGVCPKNDLRYMDREACERRGIARCVACSVATGFGGDDHGPLYRTAGRLGNLRLIDRGLERLDGIDRFHALAAHVRETYLGFGFPPERTVAMNLPVDERFSVEHASDFAAPYRALYVGSLERHKGVDRLVPVLDTVRSSGIDARLTVVGDGRLRSRMERQADERGLTDAVDFAGRRPYPELPEVYADHDLFVYPGRWAEPFGRVILEALATGTPVVGTDVGAVGETVGEAGVVTGGSVEALARGIATAIEDRSLAAMSRSARERIDRYRPGRVVADLETLYRDGGTAGGDRVDG